MSTTAANDPAVEASRFENLYKDLATMHLELDADPLELGPKRLNGKIAECRALLSRCERIFLDVSQDLHRYNKSLRIAKADLSLAKMELFANDPEVRMGRNVADREAIASNRLRLSIEEIDRLTGCAEDLNAVLVVVKAKRADLKDIQGRLKDQLKVCQEELSLGARWGRSLSSPTLVATKAQEEVRDLLASALREKRDRKAEEPPQDLPPVDEDISIPDAPEASFSPENDTSGVPEALRGSSESTDAALDSISSSRPKPPTVFLDDGLDAILDTM